MTNFTPAFERAVLHCMIYEVGPFFTLNENTLLGLIDTHEHRVAVGYTHDPADAGGETKFGISKSGNPHVDVTALTWEQAKENYFHGYWTAGGCELLSARVAILHFDGCVNNGIGRAGKFLQEVVGAAVDGSVGPGTATKAGTMNEFDVCRLLADRREQFYKADAASNPSQNRFLSGWLRRISEMRDFVRGPLVS